LGPGSAVANQSVPVRRGSSLRPPHLLGSTRFESPIASEASTGQTAGDYSMWHPDHGKYGESRRAWRTGFPAGLGVDGLRDLRRRLGGDRHVTLLMAGIFRDRPDVAALAPVIVHWRAGADVLKPSTAAAAFRAWVKRHGGSVDVGHPRRLYRFAQPFRQATNLRGSPSSPHVRFTSWR